MMTSEQVPGAYIWAWLPGAPLPVVAGFVSQAQRRHLFNYGRSYLDRPDAVSLNPAELPLRPGIQEPKPGLTMAGCLRDALPDAWGRRVITCAMQTSRDGWGADHEPSELDFMLESGSDRVGSLDFQQSPRSYQSRHGLTAELTDLAQAAELLETGQALPAGLDAALLHGTSIGGARPKALLDSPEGKYIAKFSSGTDEYPVVKSEFLAMSLAHIAGLDVARVQLRRVLGKDVLLVERFDRIQVGSGWARRQMLSALTLLELDEMMGRYASYEAFADLLRIHSPSPASSLEELFGRLVFNILCGNNDDHARNHAVFLEGDRMILTPAYDICPQLRSGSISSQGMLIFGQDRRSRIASCVAASARFFLSPSQATEIVRRLRASIQDNWTRVCDEAALTKVERGRLWGRQFLNPYIFET